MCVDDIPTCAYICCRHGSRRRACAASIVPGNSRVVLCCGVLQGVAVCCSCSVLQRPAGGSLVMLQILAVLLQGEMSGV